MNTRKIEIELPDELVDALERLSEGNGLTLSELLIAAFEDRLDQKAKDLAERLRECERLYYGDDT